MKSADNIPFHEHWWFHMYELAYERYFYYDRFLQETDIFVKDSEIHDYARKQRQRYLRLNNWIKNRITGVYLPF